MPRRRARPRPLEALGVAGQAVEVTSGAHQKYISILECIAQAKIDQARPDAQMAVLRDRAATREATGRAAPRRGRPTGAYGCDPAS